MTDANYTPHCFICHDDEETEPLLSGVCSCRPGSGHCHFSCIVDLGKMKLAEVVNNAEDELDFDIDAIRNVWWKCTVCRQYFHGEMLTKLAEEFAVITSNEYPDHHGLKMVVLRFKFWALRSKGCSIDEQAKVLNDLLAAVECHISNFGIAALLLVNAQFARSNLGDIALECGDAITAIHHFTNCKELLDSDKVRALFQFGAWKMKKIDMQIARATAKMPGVDAVTSLKSNIHIFKEYYELTKDEFGKVSGEALNASILLGSVLYKSEQFISHERQLNTSYQMSSQLHGATHPDTLEVKKNLDGIKQRTAALLSKEFGVLHVTEYCSSTDQYSLHHNNEEVGTVSAASSELIFKKGTPVTCHSFIDTRDHLNGKLGELHDFDFDTCEYTIHFEDESLQPIKIKADNFRVLFDLPKKE